jgi:hypothetical protein
MGRRWTSLFVGVVVLMATAAVAAEAPRAMLYATGNVSVNGNSVSRSAAIFEGDVITTKTDSAVTLANNGSSVVVPGNSSVVYRSDSLNIGSGSAAIKTTKGMSAHVGNLTISPVGDSAQFRVLQNGKNVEIAALEGNIAITGGAKNLAISAGHTANLQLLAVDPAPQGGSQNANSVSSQTGLFIGIAAVIATAIATAIAITARNEVSTSAP